MEEDLVQALLAFPELKALVKNRVYWKRRPPRTPLPAVVLHRIAPGESYKLEGRQTLRGPRVQADSRASTFDEAVVVERALKRAFDALTTFPFRNAVILGGGPDSTEDAPAAQGGSTEIHQSSLDVRVWHIEAI